MMRSKLKEKAPHFMLIEASCSSGLALNSPCSLDLKDLTCYRICVSNCKAKNRHKPGRGHGKGWTAKGPPEPIAGHDPGESLEDRMVNEPFSNNSGFRISIARGTIFVCRGTYFGIRVGMFSLLDLWVANRLGQSVMT